VLRTKLSFLAGASAGWLVGSGKSHELVDLARRSIRKGWAPAPDTPLPHPEWDADVWAPTFTGARG
jgi:hypothetical protein